MKIPENIPWVEKYRVKSFKDLRGQDLTINKVGEFLKNYPKKKALVLHGPPGIGKTSLSYAIASEIDAEVMELNASDLRNKSKILEIVGPASKQKSLFKKNKIILVDEVDGVSAVKDRGGLSELIRIIEDSSFPVIVTANDIWNQKFSSLRQKGELVSLKEVEYRVILSLLKEICEKENITVPNDVLTSISIRSRGDVRAAINDLQILSSTGSFELVKSREDRDKEKSIFEALQYVFKNSKIDDEMLSVYDDVNMTIDDIFLWIEENIPNEYSGEELVKAYEALSIADVFRGRIQRQRHWRFMVYEYFFLGAGIASAKKNNRAGWTSYKKPSRILKIWLQNQRAQKKKSICLKYARHTHISTKTAMKDFMLIKFLLKNEKLREELKLSKEEVTYLDKIV